MQKKVLIIAFILLLGFGLRLTHINEKGSDFSVYETSATQFLSGVNPYKETIRSFEDDQTGNQGFAYFPILLYLNAALFITGAITKTPLPILQKIPILLADLGIGLILIRQMYSKNFKALVFSLLVWYFNPYFLLSNSYVSFDPIPVFILLLAFLFLEKDEVLAASFYTLSVLTKTFPVIFLPLFFFKQKNKLQFIIVGAIITLFVSVPFLSDVNTYIKGTVLVHGARGVQGRPFFYFVSYLLKLEFLRVIPLRVYSLLSLLSGWAITLFFVVKKKFKSMDKFTLSIFPFIGFYLFAPVLNRTYLLWAAPFFILGAYNFSEQKKNPRYFYGLIGFYYVFYFIYLYFWRYGFEWGYQGI